MKTYEDYSSSPDGWNVTATLTLEDDGRFSYQEGWTDYTNASLSGGAAGTWQRGHGVIVFHAEWVEGPMYFPWVAGKELKAIEVGDALDFAHGWRLRPPSEYTVERHVSNTGAKPLTLVLEPWGIRHTLAPGESVRIVAQGRWWEGEPKVERGDDEVVYYCQNGSWATVVPEPPRQPPTPPRVPSGEATKPTAKSSITPPVKPTVKPPAPSPPKARFEPRTPSPELAALLRQWVDEQGDGNMIARLCKEHDAIPLDGNQFEVWALRTDGQVLCIDHESFAQRAEREEDAEIAYGKIAVGAKTHPELLELLPPERRGSRGVK